MLFRSIAKCYAEELANNGLARRGYPQGFEHHYYRLDKLKELVRGKTPALIFMDSMSDLFGHWVPEEEIRTVLRTMAQAPQHVYQSLTKAPARILKFLDDLPSNLWVGVSSAPDFMMGHKLTGSQQEAYMKRALSTLETVKQTTGNIVWMSLEPDRKSVV